MIFFVYLYRQIRTSKVCCCGINISLNHCNIEKKKI